uniref:Uncharacterized protein n=1 Tax=Peronospora matthiolae TaxID=2874970 RepID=A0AAV1UXP7_9STRA
MHCSIVNIPTRIAAFWSQTSVCQTKFGLRVFWLHGGTQLDKTTERIANLQGTAKAWCESEVISQMGVNL